MSPATFIFDFDGTIADSLPEIIELYNRFAPQLGGKRIEPEDRERLRGKTARGIMRELGIPFRRLPYLLVKGRGLLQTRIDQLAVIPGMHEALHALHHRGDALMILTSNTVENVQSFLARHGMDMFADVRSVHGLFTKHRALRQMLRDHALDRSCTWYVGDELRDMAAAKRAGVRAVGVTWGLNTRPLLEKKRPQTIVDEPNQLLSL